MLPGVEGFAAIGALPPMLEELKAVQLPPTFAESAARLTAALGHLMPKELVAIVSEFSRTHRFARLCLNFWFSVWFVVGQFRRRWRIVRPWIGPAMGRV